jgi:hypothetical protein
LLLSKKEFGFEESFVPLQKLLVCGRRSFMRFNPTIEKIKVGGHNATTTDREDLNISDEELLYRQQKLIGVSLKTAESLPTASNASQLLKRRPIDLEFEGTSSFKKRMFLRPPTP